MSLLFASKTVSVDEFRERADHARQQGNPAWLWPEVSVADWKEAMVHLSRAASAILGGSGTKLPDCNIMALSLACYTSGIGPLVGWWAERNLLGASSQTSELLALHQREAVARTAVTEGLSRTVVARLAESSIPVIVLKGGHTGCAYFPDPATRPASDLDLLVPAQAAVKAEVTLRKAGMTRVAGNDRESSWVPEGSASKPRHLWLVGPDDPWSIDLHRSLDFASAPGAAVVRFDEADPFANREPTALDSAFALTQPLLLLHLAVHASGGLHSLTLLRIVEIILVAQRDVPNQQLSWRDFLEVGAEIHALGAAYPALAMSEKLVPGTIPPPVLAICRELAPDRVRKVVDRHDPANVQRIDRASIAEHFMWVEGASGWTRQIWADLKAGNGPAGPRWSIYKARAYRLLRGRITR